MWQRLDEITDYHDTLLNQSKGAVEKRIVDVTNADLTGFIWRSHGRGEKYPASAPLRGAG